MKKHIWRSAKISILLLIAGILASTVGCTAKKEAPTAVEVTAQDAITYIRTMKGLDYENATSDLVERNTARVDGNSYIRLQQRYKGIPVAGRSVVYIADAKGNVTEISANVKDIDPMLNLTPAITAQQAQQSIQDYAKKTLEPEVIAQLTVEDLTEELLWIYCTDTADRLAYRLSAGAYTTFIDAHNGEVLSFSSTTAFDDVVYTDGQGQNPIKGVAPANGKYILADSERNIYIYRVNDGTQFLNTKTSMQPETYFYGNLTQVTSSSTAFEDQAAYTHLLMLRKVYDYYYTNFAEKHDVLIGVYNDNLAGHKAAGGYFRNEEFSNIPLVKQNPAFESCALVDVEKDFQPTEEIIGHEYTHTIQQKYLDKYAYANETKAINEGLADLMGELFEDDVLRSANSTASCDWVHGKRNLKEPGIYPSKLSELVLCGPSGHMMPVGTTVTTNCCVPICYSVHSASVNHCITDYEHGASTIISHCGYLMSTAAQGEGKGLSNAQLAKLIYLTTLRMPDDCSFLQFRQCMERAAETMDELTALQRECIREAFDAVGLTRTGDQLLYAGSELSVFNAIGIPQEEYTLEIVGDYEYTDEFLCHLRREYNKTVHVKAADPYKLELPVGYYRITVSAGGDVYTGNIAIVPKQEAAKADSELKVYLNFGLIEDACCVAMKLPDQVQRCYHIPKILEDSCNEINQKIYDDYYKALENAERYVQNYKEFYFLNGLSYIYGKKGDILSVVMIAFGEPTGYRVYNISLTTGKELSTQELLAQGYGTTAAEFKQAVRSAYEPWVESMTSGMFEEEYKQYVREQNLSEENISAAVPFIGPEGQLCFLGHRHFPAGSGVSAYLQDTHSGNHLTLEKCEEHSDILKVIKGDMGEEKAYAAACEFWGVTPEQVEAASDAWVAFSGIETYNGAKYYQFYLRGILDGGSSVSTWDIVYVDAWSGYVTRSLKE